MGRGVGHYRKSHQVVADDVSIAMVSYSDKMEDVVNFSQHSRSDIGQRLLEYVKRHDLPRGNSPLLAAINKAADLLQPAQFGDSIILITDGVESEERERFETVRQRLIAGGIRLFSMLWFDSTPRTEEELSGPVRFERLSEETGGWFIITRVGPDAATAAANGFLTSINENHGLSVQVRLPEPIQEWRKWKLTIVDAKGKPSTKTTLSYPRFLSPCEQRN
ncbi:MAG: VWA domain-containing protein [Acidobacteriia bacterium]|nr:VWA domain-containing protein [Terriglobia bacterium]